MSVQAKEVSETAPVTVVDSTIKLPGYDGPASGNTRSTKTQRGSTTESNLETYTKTTQVHRTCRGPVSIKEICFDAKYILLENSGKRGDVDISNWQIVRKVDNNEDNIFTFPTNTIFPANTTIKILAANQAQSKQQNEFVHTSEWGNGDLINTRVLNEKKSERALHNQRTS